MKIADSYKQEFLVDLAQLIQVASVEDLQSKKEGAPFGVEIAKVMDVFEKIAKKYGFQVERDDGYAMHAQYGEGDDYIGILGHLDVVDICQPEEWDSDPFTMVEKDGFLYGRGVNDDKGPLLAALYAARILKDSGVAFPKALRIIAGGAEETSWKCMEHYFQTHKQPICGFSPDGNFPIVNGEKGILCVNINFQLQNREFAISCPQHKHWVNEHIDIVFYNTKIERIAKYAIKASAIQQCGRDVHVHYVGKQAMSRNPQRGINPLFIFFEDMCNYPFVDEGNVHLCSFMKDCLLYDTDGKKAGLYHIDKDMGTTSICPCSILSTEHMHTLYLDIRYVKSTSKEELSQQIDTLSKQYNFSYEVVNEKRLLYVKEQSFLIQALKKAYCNIMKEEAHVFTKGGASYARVLDHGVAFGATFEHDDPRPHMANENISLNSLWKALEIYIESIKELLLLDM